MSTNQQASERTPLLPATAPTDSSSSSNSKPPPSMSSEVFWKIGAVYGATAVAFGAFGAHGLKKVITEPARLAGWSTAAQYQLIHAAVLLVVPNHPVAASLFTAGMTLFSGSIYALTLDPARFRFLGPVTPLGGLCLIAGWMALAFGKSGGAPRLPRF
ncbi:hypothetical protein B0H67DRAFT_481705 [Lasiosphaeris hirsuta]|uniref:DUF423-domain-containing protein n=1 Tax=Lasiosphaeris hirsuta TaxID=260670 RepID=A0AA40E6B7_9PEZI|nr:hypothetical protein B0H67DRAFT_481705 [Lasiosphaeris hirsuta]